LSILSLVTVPDTLTGSREKMGPSGTRFTMNALLFCSVKLAVLSRTPFATTYAEQEPLEIVRHDEQAFLEAVVVVCNDEDQAKP
jgi:hypothetical protein